MIWIDSFQSIWVEFYACHNFKCSRLTAENLILARTNSSLSPVNARALDAEQNAEVDAGPARVGLATVAAELVSWQRLDPL